jgi:hypothetical protein
MKVDEITRSMELEPKHFKLRDVPTPVLDSGIYTTFGKRLFDLYKKYSIEPTDQRELERLAYLLTSFTIGREQVPRSFGQKLKELFKR